MKIEAKYNKRFSIGDTAYKVVQELDVRNIEYPVQDCIRYVVRSFKVNYIVMYKGQKVYSEYEQTLDRWVLETEAFATEKEAHAEADRLNREDQLLRSNRSNFFGSIKIKNKKNN